MLLRKKNQEEAIHGNDCANREQSANKFAPALVTLRQSLCRGLFVTCGDVRSKQRYVSRLKVIKGY